METTTVDWHRASTARYKLRDFCQPVLVVYCGRVIPAGWSGSGFWSGVEITSGVTWFARMPDAPA